MCRKLYVIFLALLSVTTSCKNKLLLGERFYGIEILNNSAKPVYFYCDIRGSEEPQYPDTTLPSRKLAIKINANSIYAHTAMRPWVDIVNDMPHDTMAIYFFDADTYEHTDWNEIRAKYLVLKRYSVDAEYLKKNNATITYP